MYIRSPLDANGWHWFLTNPIFPCNAFICPETNGFFLSVNWVNGPSGKHAFANLCGSSLWLSVSGDQLDGLTGELAGRGYGGSGLVVGGSPRLKSYIVM